MFMARYELTSRPHHVVPTHAVVGHQLHQLPRGEQPPPYYKPWRFQKAISNTYRGQMPVVQMSVSPQALHAILGKWFWCQQVHQLDRYSTTPDSKPLSTYVSMWYVSIWYVSIAPQLDHSAVGLAAPSTCRPCRI